MTNRLYSPSPYGVEQHIGNAVCDEILRPMGKILETGKNAIIF